MFYSSPEIQQLMVAYQSGDIKHVPDIFQQSKKKMYEFV